MPGHLASGICLVWLFRIVLGIAMCCCMAPNFHSAIRGFLRTFSQGACVLASGKEQCEEEHVAQQLRLTLAERDHHSAFKLWQRVKSLEGRSSVQLVDVVHMLRALGKTHSEVVSELRSAFDCNPSLGDSAVEMLDDLRRRGMLGLLGKIIHMLNDMGINHSKGSAKPDVCDTCSSDDDVSTQVASSECPTPLDSSDDEEEISLPSHSWQLPAPDGQISIAALLALRPLPGKAPAGYLHAVRDENQGSMTLSSESSQATGRWESLRPNDPNFSPKRPSKFDRSAPWRKCAPEVSVVSMAAPGSDGDCRHISEPVRANKPGSLSSSLIGSTALRPSRKL